jgi:hypothetical protein
MHSAVVLQLLKPSICTCCCFKYFFSSVQEAALDITDTGIRNTPPPPQKLLRQYTQACLPHTNTICARAYSAHSFFVIMYFTVSALVKRIRVHEANKSRLKVF